MAYYNLKGSELCKYDNKTDKVTGEITPEVRINRTLAIDSMYSEIESRSIVLPPNLDDIDGFYDQMCALTKVPKLNPNTGNIEYSYVGGTVDEYGKPTTSGKPDHYTHVSVYNLIAWQAQVYRRFRKLKAAVL